MPARSIVLAPFITTTALLAACAGGSPLAPIDPPAKSAFDAALTARGAQLAAIGNCNVCHTAPGGKMYAGGRALKTTFGTIYGTNITPDPDTGIGRWSEAAFSRALREGVDREGRHLYPAFPYDHFTKLTDDDIRALYAYVMTRDPVRAEAPRNDLSFPFNLRGLIAGWKMMFLERGVYQPDARQSAAWNRGAYLVQGLAHCGACHTPRNALGAEKQREYLSGGTAEDWHAPALDANSASPVPWSAEQLYIYLRTGLENQHAIAAGPMAPVVHNLAAVPEREVRAMAFYLAQFAGPPSPDRQKKAAGAIAQANRETAQYPLMDRASAAATGGRDGERAYRNGAAIYAGACAACHDHGRAASSGAALHLVLGTATTVPTSKNLLHIILEGIVPPEGEPGRFMPGFAHVLTDAQVKDLATYIRAYFGQEPPWHDVDAELRKARKGASDDQARR